MFAVANSALINMMMASRLLYGMAKQQVLPPVLAGCWRDGARRGWRSCSPPRSRWACCSTSARSQNAGQCDQPARRHHRAAAAGRVHRGQHLLPGAAQGVGRPRALLAPTVPPIIAAVCCAYLVTPFSGRDPQQYVIAGLLLAVGVVLWLITFFINRAMWGRQTYLKNPEGWRAPRPSPSRFAAIASRWRAVESASARVLLVPRTNWSGGSATAVSEADGLRAVRRRAGRRRVRDGDVPVRVRPAQRGHPPDRAAPGRPCPARWS